MEDFFSTILSSDLFTPSGQRYSWQAWVLWLHGLSDALISLSFFSIFAVLLYLAQKRKERQIHRLLLIFSVFIFGCGITCVLNIATLWQPVYLMEGFIKLLTALAALGTTIAFIQSMPVLLSIPTKKFWDRTARKLQQQVDQLRVREEVIRQSQAALQQAEERYSMLEQVFDSVIIHADRQIVFVNPAAVQFLGAAHSGELIGKSILSFVHPDYLAVIQQRLSKVDQRQSIPLKDQKMVRLDGQVVDVETTATTITFEGKPAIQTIIRDISERKQHEKELEASEAKFRGIFEAEVMGIAIINQDGFFIETNQAFAQLSGYSQREIAGGAIHWSNTVSAEHRNVDLEAIQELKQTGRVTPYEREGIRKDGSRIPVWVAGALLDENRVVAFITDMTEHQKAQRKLALAEERFKLLAKATKDFVYDWNVPTDEMWWNEQFYEQFEYGEEDLAPGSTAWTERLHPDDRNRVWENLHQALGQGSNQFSAEYRFRKPDGSYAYILERAYMLRDETGTAVRMVGSMSDLTPLKKVQEELEDKALTLQQFNAELEESEAALRESLSKFQAVFDSDMIGICFWSTSGGIIEANNAFLSTIGYSKQDLQLGLIHWSQITPLEYQHLDENARQKLAQTGVNMPYEKEYIRKDGSRVAVIVGGAMLDGYTNVGISFMLNISERKKADKQLQYTLDELKKKNYELDTYVYKVSHDLRAPLASILGLIGIIKDESEISSIRRYLGLIENRAQKLDVFIQSVLAHSRTNNIDIQIDTVDFSKIINESFDELKYLPRSEKVRLTVQQEGDYVFQSDELKISIILKNFISNAIKYSNPHLDKPFIHFSIKTTPTEALITIQDNGIGINAQYLSMIFDMFFRATEKSDGSGLGLYIVKQTIEKLGGSITVESHIGEGTIFRIALPNLQVVELQPKH